MNFYLTILSCLCFSTGCAGLAFRSTQSILDKSCSNGFAPHHDNTEMIDESPSTGRRSFLEGVLKSSAAMVATAAIVSSPADQALASGGATAGGAYLLSAKQRYNERVKAGVTGFLALKAPLEQGDIGKLREYFTSEETGAWKDLTTAGYLLANAFRRNSTASPDSLPSVKAWKAFATEVEKMTAALKKKDTAGALAVYGNAMTALDGYLEKVELQN